MGYTSDFGYQEFDVGLETLERIVMKSEKKMHIDLGVPKEITPDEKRVALAPSGVKIVVQQGHSVVVERDAGIHCNFTNEEYIEAGAIVVSSAEEVYKKIKPDCESRTATAKRV